MKELVLALIDTAVVVRIVVGDTGDVSVETDGLMRLRIESTVVIEVTDPKRGVETLYFDRGKG